jgi:hypothetical protein
MIERKYQRKSESWWNLKDVCTATGIRAGTCNQSNTEDVYGACCVEAGCNGIVLEKVNGGLIVQFNDGNMWAHLKCRYCDLDLINRG